MNDLINNLKKFAVNDFPVETVSDYILKYKFSDNELNNYCFYKDSKYARHLVHKEKDFDLVF